MIDLTGQTAVVTGGSRGIGAACCRMLAQAGARVVVNYRVERASAEQLVAEITGSGAVAIETGADVSVADEAEMLIGDAVDRFGRLDILVNNAGIWNGSPIDEMSDSEWSRMLDVNLTGTFNAIRSAVPHMKEAGSGRIVNISSTAGQRGEANHAHYAASKGGVISLTKSLAAELAGHGITTNCVAPGWVETDMTRECLDGTTGDAVRAGIPMGRVGRPEEIAGAVLFLASELAGFVNGEILNVNGGNVLCG
jgi:3-oxoacyl-[acyl-carrier protein] reductase